ncbi:hypothetical protein BDF20DRAFT_991803 [Mycotypha africana]|uniref:uncharacterized protein n=1 Tax=Mycotypha africana TaxID=64632 RepID=UPI002301F600|nr:uncharacterized protein BDF20DRAFT_991803 [Mycotypha africana]KAI8967826.1 hypothetical protein BDF20DRAFT_991803 [Mycotypha africana]
MPTIPATRLKVFERVQDDSIQWSLLQSYYTKPDRNDGISVVSSKRHHYTNETTVTTADTAKRFIKIVCMFDDIKAPNVRICAQYSGGQKNLELNKLVAEIKRMHKSVAFDPYKFIDDISTTTISTLRLLTTYFQLVARLSQELIVLNLSILLERIHDNVLDETLLELLSLGEENICKAYIESMREDIIKSYFIKDGERFLQWKQPISIDRVKRLSIILTYYYEVRICHNNQNTSTKRDQLQSLLLDFLRLQKNGLAEYFTHGILTTSTLITASMKQINKIKYQLINTFSKQQHMNDTLVMRIPLFLLVSQWFYEFSDVQQQQQQSASFSTATKMDEEILRLTEFILYIIQLNQTVLDSIIPNLQKISPIPAVDDLMDPSFLLYTFYFGCQQLVSQGKAIVLISNSMDVIKNSLMLSLEFEDATVEENDNPLASTAFLTIAQFALHQIHNSTGLTYADWFSTTLIQPSTSIFNKLSDSSSNVPQSLTNKRKKAFITFMHHLQRMIPHESLPAILQIHGKVISQWIEESNPKSKEIMYSYLTAVRKRLKDLDCQSTLEHSPAQLSTPIASDANLLKLSEYASTEKIATTFSSPNAKNQQSIENRTIEDILTEFIKKDCKVVPAPIMQASIFKQLWFRNTFLPKIIEWQGPCSGRNMNDQSRNELLEAKYKFLTALKLKGKIPDSLFEKYSLQSGAKVKKGRRK